MSSEGTAEKLLTTIQPSLRDLPLSRARCASNSWDETPYLRHPRACRISGAVQNLPESAASAHLRPSVPAWYVHCSNHGVPTNFSTRTGAQTLVVAICVGLIASPGLVAATIQVPISSLSEKNIISSPFPSSYPKAALAHVARSNPTAKPMAKSAPQSPPSEVVQTKQNSALAELAFQTKASQQLCQDLQRSPAEPEMSPLLAAVLGSKNPSTRRTFRLGYGKMATDNPDALGRKNAMRLEEPGVLYVKTSVNF